MGDKKHFVFSARTTKEGLRILNQIRAEKKLDWQGLLIPAVNAHYSVEVPMPEKPPVDEAKLKAKADREEAKAEAKAKADNARVKATADKAKAKAKAKAEAEKAAKEKAAAKIAKANTAPATSAPIAEPADPMHGHEQAETKEAASFTDLKRRSRNLPTQEQAETGS